MEVVAAAVPVNIKDLAGGVETGDQAALQRLQIKFVRADASGRDLRPVKAENAGNRQGKIVDGLRNALPLRCTESGDRLRQSKAGVAQQCAPKAVVEHSGQQIFRGQLRHERGPLPQQRLRVRRGQPGQEVNVER